MGKTSLFHVFHVWCGKVVKSLKTIFLISAFHHGYCLKHDVEKEWHFRLMSFSIIILISQIM